MSSNTMSGTITQTSSDTFPAQDVTSFKMSDYAPERRRHERRRVRLRAEARRMDNTVAAQRAPKFAIVLLDVSEGGIRATSRVPVVDGERLLIMLPPDARLPQRIFGKVIRCSPRRDGYGLAIKFDYVPAA